MGAKGSSPAAHEPASGGGPTTRSAAADPVPTTRSAAAEPICLDCIPTTAIPTSSFDACDELYAEWDKCLKAHRGNIADCIAPMNVFKMCHENERVRRAAKKDEGISDEVSFR
mmetsp:Transcript_60574/g.166337  ORF Transcript_60574/g.166337 Transcript_60574/m.166337 type:complete len:113 (+) Transcript_60574:28-366(+)